MSNPFARVHRLIRPRPLACPHCDDVDVFPTPGPFGPIGAALGLFRHTCRSCRRSFWQRESATACEGLGGTDEATDGQWPRKWQPDASVDLRALDREFDRTLRFDRDEARTEAI